MDKGKLSSLGYIVLTELDAAKDAIQDFRGTMHGWQYARERAAVLAERVEGVARSFEGLVAELGEELDREAAV